MTRALDNADYVMWSGDGRLLAAVDGVSTGEALVLDGASGQEMLRMQHTALVTDMAWCGDGSRLAMASSVVRVAHPQAAVERTLADIASPWIVAWSPRGLQLAIGTMTGVGLLVDPLTGQLHQHIPVGAAPVR